MALPNVGTDFGVFRNFVKKMCKSFYYDPGRMPWSSETYLFNSSYNIDQSNTVTRRFKI